MKPASLIRLAPALCVGLPLALGLTTAAAAGAASASQVRLAGGSSTSLDSDMEFARALAARFAYVDLAEQVITSLEARGLDGQGQEKLGLLKCDVYAAGAKGERRPERREQVYDKAVAAYQSYLEAYPYSGFLPEAEKGYVDLVNSYGRVLEQKLPELLGDEAKALREKIKEVVGGGLELTNDLIQQTFSARSLSEKNERYRLMLNRGNMLLLMANVSEDGVFFFAKAEQTLEELALEAGESSGAGLNAFVLLAKVKMARGKPEEAIDFGEFVMEVTIPSSPQSQLDSGWTEATFDEKVPRWRLAEVGVAVIVDALQALGKDERAAFWALHYYNTWKIEGFDLSPLGHLGLLACARALLGAEGHVGGQLSGGELQWFATQAEMNDAGHTGSRNTHLALDLALSIAQYVNEENQGNTLQIRAQQVISSVISRPGITVSPDVLYEAARGEYNARNYASAIDAFKDILRRLERRDEATRQEYTPKVLYHIGKSLSYLDRNLEAAMAFREAATTWAGDPEYQEKLAQGYYGSIGQAKRTAVGDGLLQNLYLEAEKLLVSASSSDDGSITYRQAERSYSEKDYVNARSLFLQVAEGGELYEKALVRAALCLYKVKDFVNAGIEFKRYLESYVTDPRTKPVGARKLETRQQAMAMATFYLGRLAFIGQDFDEVVDWLADYQTAFPGQDDYGPNALYMVVNAQVAQRDITGAQLVVKDMVEVYGRHERTGAAAIQIFAALKAERQKAEQAGDEGEVQRLTLEMAEYIHLSNELGEKRSYSNLRAESSLWIELEDWDEAETTLRLILSSFDADSADIQSRVLPDLGLVLLEQKRVPEAYAVLDPLVPKDQGASLPSSSVISRWCQAVTGWVEGDSSTVVEVPGVGGDDNLKLACSLLLKLTDSEGARDKYTCPWYSLKFDTAFAYYQWGQVDSVQTKQAIASIENLQNLLGQSRLDDIRDKCGDDLIQKRFLWLEGKLRSQ